MKHIKLFEDYSPYSDLDIEDEYIDDEENNSIEEGVRPYANGEKMDDVIIVDSDKEFTGNPLFYIWSEYPKYKLMKNLDGTGFLRSQYEFYRDKDKNKYFVADDLKEFKEGEISELIKKHDWNYARNVDAFVDGADSDDYKHWLDSIK